MNISFRKFKIPVKNVEQTPANIKKKTKIIDIFIVDLRVEGRNSIAVLQGFNRALNSV